MEVCLIADSPKVLLDLYSEAKMARQRQRGSPWLILSPQNSWALQNLSEQKAWETAAANTHTHTYKKTWRDEYHLKTDQEKLSKELIASILFTWLFIWSIWVLRHLNNAATLMTPLGWNHLFVCDGLMAFLECRLSKLCFFYLIY